MLRSDCTIGYVVNSSEMGKNSDFSQLEGPQRIDLKRQLTLLNHIIGQDMVALYLLDRFLKSRGGDEDSALKG